MSWKIDFYDGVEDQILDMPLKIQARIIKLIELMEKAWSKSWPASY